MFHFLGWIAWEVLKLAVMLAIVLFMGSLFFITAGGPGLFWHYGLLEEAKWWQEVVVRLPAFIALVTIFLWMVANGTDDRPLVTNGRNPYTH